MIRQVTCSRHKRCNTCVCVVSALPWRRASSTLLNVHGPGELMTQMHVPLWGSRGESKDLRESRTRL